MHERRWPIIASVAIGVLVVAAIGWAAGRSSAPDDSPQGEDNASGTAIRVIDGVPVGVQHSRAGALAAADNYVATSSDTVVQNPKRYEQLVRQAYAPGYQGSALRDGAAARKDAPQSVDLYAGGGKSVAIIAARRLDSYGQTRATTTTWVAGVTWGPGRVPGHTLSLIHI